MRSINLGLACLAGAICILCTTGSTGAVQKGSGGGSTTTTGGSGGTGGTSGEIIYRNVVRDGVWRMNADATGKALVFAAPFELGDFMPSHHLHNGVRLYLNFAWDDDLIWNEAQGAYETGPNAHAILRFTAPSGTTTDFALSPSFDPFYMNVLRWTPSDGRVSFIGRKTIDGVGYEAGLYWAQVTYDALGNLATVTEPTLVQSLYSDDGIDAGGRRPIIRGYDWNPTESSIVFSHTDFPELWIAGNGAPNLLRSSTAAQSGSPAWAPGSKNKIAFTEGDKLYVIGTNATGLQQLSQAPRVKGRASGSTNPSWSPDGSSLIFLEWIDTGSRNLMKISSTGLGKVKLVEGFPMGWR